MIKTKKNYVLQTIGEEYMVIPVGTAAEQFRGMLTLNESAAFYWRELEKGTTFDSLAALAMERFEDADEETVKRDIMDFLEEISFATETTP